MGASNFLGLNWGLFRDRPGDIDRVVENFMRIIGGGMFAEGFHIEPDADPLPIRIQVEFEDDDLSDEDEELL